MSTAHCVLHAAYNQFCLSQNPQSFQPKMGCVVRNWGCSLFFLFPFSFIGQDTKLNYLHQVMDRNSFIKCYKVLWQNVGLWGCAGQGAVRAERLPSAGTNPKVATKNWVSSLSNQWLPQAAIGWQELMGLLANHSQWLQVIWWSSLSD